MKKIIVSAQNINNHFHDNDILFSVEDFSSFNFGEIMIHCFGYDNPDEYNDFFTVVFEGKEYSYWELWEETY